MKEVYNGAFELTAENKTDLGETSDHRQLRYRDAENQHPISAIEGLTEALAGHSAEILALKEAEAQVIELGEDVDEKLTILTRYKEDAITGIETAEASAVNIFTDIINDTLPNTSAEAETLTPGSEASAVCVFDEDTGLVFTFGIPRGADGQDGQDGQDYVLTQADKAEIAEIVAEDGTTATAETLSPGASATASVSYNNGLVFTFGIPRGADGQDGQDGQDYVLTQQDKEDIADLVAAEIGDADIWRY